MNKRIIVLMVVGVLILFVAFVSEVSAVPKQIASCQDSGCTMTIPRYKIFQSMQNPSSIWAIYDMHSSGSGTNFIKTIDGGNTWTGASAMSVMPYMDFHGAISGDSNDNIYVSARSYDTSSSDVAFRKVNSPANSPSNLYPLATKMNIAAPSPGNTQTPNVLAQDSNNIWMFMRKTNDAAGNVYYRRSTDGGQTWNSAQWVSQTGTADVRIGSNMVAGQPAILIWYNNLGLRYFIWNTTQNQFVANPDYTVVWNTGFSDQRAFGFNYANGKIHVVYADRGRLVHRYKNYDNGATTTWSQIIVEDYGNGDLDASLFSPQLTVHGNDLYLFYTYKNSDTNKNVMYRKWNDSAGQWGAANLIYSDGLVNHYVHGPAVVNPSSTFIPVIWSHSDGSTHTVWYETISTTASPCVDSDTDGYNTTTGGACGTVADCNDNNINIYPGATEICGNVVDEDCSGADLSCSADVNFDGNINVIDLAIVLFNQGKNPATTGYGHLDLNGDGTITWSDVGIVIASI